MPSGAGGDPGGGGGRRTPALPLAAALLGLTFVALGACAKEEPPPGARPDAAPPRVTEIVPGRDTVVPGFDDDARIGFDEPVRVGADLDRQLVASPAWRYDVSTGFSDIRIRPSDGWREGVVYCFAVPEGIADLLQNRMPSPIEFCFSTGAPLTETTVTGTVTERVTGQPARDARVLFRAPPDSTPYAAVVDESGQFRLRALPPAEYVALAFRDQNRNLRLDPRLEPSDSASFELQGPTSVATLELALVEPDSTAPVLVSVEVVDSLTLRLQFDDALPPEQEDAEVAVTDTTTGRRVPVARVAVGEPTALGPPDTAAAPPDTAVAPGDTVGGPGDTLAAPADTAGAAGDTARVPPDTAPPAALPDVARAAGGPEPAGRGDLPAPVVSVRLVRPLDPGTYRVEASGFVNLRDLTGGGDTTVVVPPGGGP